MRKKISCVCLLAMLVLAMPKAFGQQYVNYPLPQMPDTLRILGIGNSFTDDGMMYLPELLEAAGIKNVVLARLYIGGCSLARHCKEYADNTPNYIYWKSTENSWVKAKAKATIVEGIEDEPWDVVVMQQNSGNTGIYATFQPYLNQLMDIVRTHCPNAGATLAWQQTWAFARESTHGEFPRYHKDMELMYKAIVQSVQQLTKETPIQIIIPSGTAIQNMRRSEFCDSLDLTRDGYHLNMRLGRYTAACTWFQTLIAPSLRQNIMNSTCRLEGTKNELTAEEAKAAREAALHAWMRIYSVW